MTEHNEQWARMLRGEHPVARLENRIHRLLPSNPRCKICFAPFGGLGGVVLNVFGRQASAKNPTVCNVCEAYAQSHPGGAEVDLAMMFADVRGSTTLAEGMTPTEFSQTLNKFFSAATRILIGHVAWIDKFVGDEIVAFFFPNSVPGKHQARVALDAARELLETTRSGSLPIGIGLHYGSVYVGTVGGVEVSDVTALGDDVNVTARLASAAKANTIVISEVACRAAGFKDVSVPLESLELKGKSALVPVRIITG